MIPVREQLGIHAFGVNAFTPERGRHVDQRPRRGGLAPAGAVRRARGECDLRGLWARRSTRPPGRSCRFRPSYAGRRPAKRVVLALGGTTGEARTSCSTGVRHGRSRASRWPPTASSATACTRWTPWAGASSRCRAALGLNHNYACFAALNGRDRRRRVRPPEEGRFKRSVRSASKRAGTDRPGRRARTTRGSRKPFAERERLGLGQALLAVVLLVLLVHFASRPPLRRAPFPSAFAASRDARLRPSCGGWP